MSDLRQLEAAATPGPWAVMRRWPRKVVPADQVNRSWGASVDPEADAMNYAHPILEVQESTRFDGWEKFKGRRFDTRQNEADAALIAASRNALPALLDVVDEAKALIVAYERFEGSHWHEEEQAYLRLKAAVGILEAI